MTFVVRGFLGSLITNLKSVFKNSKWLIQYGGLFLSSSYLLESPYSCIFGITDYESDVSFSKFKIADLTWRTNFEKISRFLYKLVFIILIDKINYSRDSLKLFIIKNLFDKPNPEVKLRKTRKKHNWI